MSESPSPDVPKKRLGLASRILIALGLGAACGLFFGELCAWLGVVGEVYVGLLQMTVLPYITVSLVAGIGRLDLGESRRLLVAGLKALLLLWGLGAVVIVFSGLAFPAWELGSFFSAETAEVSRQSTFLELLLPVNVFRSLADAMVPAVVFFCLCLGMALIGLPNKGKVIDVLDVVSEALQRVNKAMVGLAPYGTFAIAAHAAGTMQFEEIGRLQAYLVVYTSAIFFLTFLVLPFLITTLTPFSYREIMRGSRTALITAFATSKVIVVLPLLVENTQELFRKYAAESADTDRAVATLYPVAYPFPTLGKLLALLFIPFSAWFAGHTMGFDEYPGFLVAGYMSYFGGPVLATPFLLEMHDLPADLFQLFLASGVYASRIGDLLGVMHLVALTTLATAAVNGLLRPQWRRLGRGLLLAAALGALGVFGIRAWLDATFKESYSRQRVLQEMVLTLPDDKRVPSHGLDSEPNPVPLEEGEGLLRRIRRRGVIRIGVRDTARPFAFRNEDQRLVGLDVELAHLLASQLGVTIEFVPFEMATLQDQLEADHFDLAMSGIVRSAERQEELRLSDPYLDVTAGLVVTLEDAEVFLSPEALRAVEGLRLAIVDPTFEGSLRQAVPDAEIVLLDAARDFFVQEEGAERIHGLLSNMEAGAAWTLKYPHYAVVNPLPYRLKASVVYPIGKGDPELREYVNYFIEERTRDGTIEAVYDHWIRGMVPDRRGPRWSVIRDVLGWVKLTMHTDAQDAMGHACWDELHGKEAFEVCERDDGLVDPIPAAIYFSEFPDWDPSTQAAMGFARGRVLDVGVGAGRYALYLQAQGHELVGIDISPLALEVCRLRGVKDVRGCAATQVSPSLGHFGTILMMGNNFGLTANRKRAPWLLRRFASLCSSDARIIAQTQDVYTTDDPIHLAYQARNRARGRMSGQIRLRVRYRIWATPFFDYLMVSLPELEEIVAETPWRIEEILEAEHRPGSYTAVLARSSLTSR